MVEEYEFPGWVSAMEALALSTPWYRKGLIYSTSVLYLESFTLSSLDYRIRWAQFTRLLSYRRSSHEDHNAIVYLHPRHWTLNPPPTFNLHDQKTNIPVPSQSDCQSWRTPPLFWISTSSFTDSIRIGEGNSMLRWNFKPQVPRVWTVTTT